MITMTNVPNSFDPDTPLPPHPIHSKISLSVAKIVSVNVSSIVSHFGRHEIIDCASRSNVSDFPREFEKILGQIDDPLDDPRYSIVPYLNVRIDVIDEE